MGTGELLEKPNKLWGSDLRWTSILSRGSRILLAASCYRNRDKLSQLWPVKAPRLYCTDWPAVSLNIQRTGLSSCPLAENINKSPARSLTEVMGKRIFASWHCHFKFLWFHVHNLVIIQSEIQHSRFISCWISFIINWTSNNIYY